MKWTFEYKEDSNFVRVNDEGAFEVNEHSRKMEELISQDYWEPGINVLFDCRKLDFSHLDYDSIRRVADNFAADDRLLGCSKIALLMKSIADFGRGRQFEILTDERMCADIRIFMDEKQAVRWLES